MKYKEISAKSERARRYVIGDGNDFMTLRRSEAVITVAKPIAGEADGRSADTNGFDRHRLSDSA